MKKKIRYIKVGFESILGRHDWIIAFGFLMAVGTLVKLLGHLDFSSDWFWFIAGVGLFIEGLIASAKQRRFDKKYKILSQEEFERLVANDRG